MLLVLAGCSSPEPAAKSHGLHERMERYQQALTGAAGGSPEQLAACLALEDPDLAGDCALVATREAAGRGRA